MRIIVYGPGCARCYETERVVRNVAAELGLDADVAKVSDYAEMAKAGVMQTPAVSIDGVLKVSGRIPKADEVRGWFTPRP